MKVLITGACGFIGMHVCMKLQKEGHAVLGIDAMNDYYSVALKEQRALMLQKNGITLLRQDIAEKGVLAKAVESFQPTHLIHLAAQAGVRYSLVDPHSYIRNNIHAFLEVLEAGRAYPHMPIIWASSSSVYGANTKIPFSETDPTDSPVNLYGATKKSDEAMAFAYHHLFSLKLIGLRFFTVYGPWGRPDMAYFLFADRIARGEEILLFGKGMKRDFTYIDDIVHGICSALQYDKPWALFNLGNSHPEPVERLIQLLEENLKKKARIRLVDAAVGDMQETYADISLAAREIGFSPNISLEEGVRRFCCWYLQQSQEISL